MSSPEQIVMHLHPLHGKASELLITLKEREADLQASLSKVQNVFVNKPSEGDTMVERNLAASLAQIIRETKIAYGELEQLQGVIQNTIHSISK